MCDHSDAEVDGSFQTDPLWTSNENQMIFSETAILLRYVII